MTTSASDVVVRCCENEPLPAGTVCSNRGLRSLKQNKLRWMRASSLPTMILGLCIAPYVGDLFNKQVHDPNLCSVEFREGPAQHLQT